MAPFGDLGVVAADEDFGDFPAAKVGGASVMGKIEHGAAMRQGFVQRAGLRFFGALEQAKGFVLRRGFVAEGAGKQAGDGDENQSSRELPAGKNKVADGDFFGGEVLGYALVHAFVASADEEDAVELSVAASRFLREALAGGGEQYGGGVGIKHAL